MSMLLTFNELELGSDYNDDQKSFRYKRFISKKRRKQLKFKNRQMSETFKLNMQESKSNELISGINLDFVDICSTNEDLERIIEEKERRENINQMCNIESERISVAPMEISDELKMEIKFSIENKEISSEVDPKSIKWFDNMFNKKKGGKNIFMRNINKLEKQLIQKENDIEKKEIDIENMRNIMKKKELEFERILKENELIKLNMEDKIKQLEEKIELLNNKIYCYNDKNNENEKDVSNEHFQELCDKITDINFTQEDQMNYLNYKAILLTENVPNKREIYKVEKYFKTNIDQINLLSSGKVDEKIGKRYDSNKSHAKRRIDENNYKGKKTSNRRFEKRYSSSLMTCDNYEYICLLHN